MKDTVDAVKRKFGIFILRGQPFHKGHQEIINEILLDGRVPIIILGSSNHDRDRSKNPLTYAQRKELVRLVFPNVNIVFVRGIDYSDWTTWYNKLIQEIKETLYKEFDVEYTDLSDIAKLYSHNKEVDRQSFIFNGIEYTNTFYTEIFKDQGFGIQQVVFVNRIDVKIDVNARDIREDLEGRKHLMDARVYNKLKEWNWK